LPEQISVVVEVELFGRLSRIAGMEKVSLQVPQEFKVREVLQTLTDKLGENAKAFLFDSENRSLVAILVNERHVPGEKTLQNGDVISLIPILAGG
jgi:molybdopterin converting factor small subunit